MKTFFENVETALFDLDGTLVETNIDFSSMKREMISLAIDYNVFTEEMASLDILAIVDKTYQILESRDDIDAAKSMHNEAMRRLERIELVHASNTEEIPFAKEALEILHRHGIAVGIVTRNCRKASVISMNAVGIKSDVLITREDTMKRKPHPDQLLIALNKLGKPLATSVMVGDHIMDIESGKAAGIKTIGLLREHKPPDFFDKVCPDFIARDMREVLNAIVDSDC